MEEEDQPHETQTQVPTTTTTTTSQCERNEVPVRSRWTPKPEQILILESIFNSGMVNPPKEETVKIRKLLEKFGSVGDANVFYWFQNRRSRSRRRQRQIQASLITTASLEQYQLQQQQLPMHARYVSGGCGGSDGGGGGSVGYHGGGSTAYTAAAPTTAGFRIQQPIFFPIAGGSSTSSSSSSSSSASSSSSQMGGPDEMFSVSGQASGSFHDQNYSTSVPSSFQHLDTSKLHSHEFGLGSVIRVFINGVPTDVESGPLNMKTMFGEDLMLVHSSGVALPHDEYGVLVSGLEHGESYFLVSRSI